MNIKEFKSRFDPVFQNFLEEQIVLVKKLTEDPFICETLEHVVPLAMSGGKRIRPYIAYLTFKIHGGRVEDEPHLLKFLCALELFHLFGLVHDDIIDQGDERHGVPTIHTNVGGRFVRQGRVGDTKHVAEGEALLIGDLLFSWAHQALNCEGTLKKEKLDAAKPYFFTMSNEVMVGQLLDVDLMTREAASESLVLKKTYLKTASYTFTRPMQIGAALAGMDLLAEAQYHEIGEAVGMGFQIQDDLFDLIKTSDQIHKMPLSDLRGRQHTVFSQYVFDHGTGEQKKTLLQFLGAPLTEADQPAVVSLMEETGALAYGQALLTTYFDKAEALVAKLPTQHVATDALCQLVRYIRERNV